MSRFGFGILTEDPMYDEDGVLVDEDFDNADWEDTKVQVDINLDEPVEACYIMDCDPYSTINS